MTTHFTLEELVVSDTFPDLAAAIEPTEAQIVNLKFLVGTILEPCREFIGRPFRVLSGIRSEALNRAVKGEKDSQHLYAEAVDFTIPDDGKELWRAFTWMKAHCQHQSRRVILYTAKNFIHVGMYPVTSGKSHEGPKFLYNFRGKYYVDNPFGGAV